MSERTKEIPLASQEAVRVAALLGESFPLQVLIDAGVEVSQLDSLFDKSILVQDNATQASFADRAFREAVLEKIPWSFRRNWSEKLATILEKMKGDPELLGRLHLFSQAFDRARPYLIRAAENACMTNDYPKALTLLKQVFEIWPVDDAAGIRTRLLREMARCAANTGDREAATIAWDELLETTREDGNLAGQIEAHQQLSELAGSRGSRSAARDHLKIAAELSSQTGNPDLEARQWFEYASFLMTQVRLQAANAAFEKAYHAALKGKDLAVRIEIMATRALGQAMAGNADVAFEWVEEALHEAIKHEMPEQVTYVYRRMANVNEYSGNFQAYLELELKALDRCQANHEEELEQACLSCLSYAFFRCGLWKRSQEMLRLVLEELDLQGELRMVAVGTRTVIAALRGERRSAQINRKSFDELVRVYGGAYMRFHVLWGLGVLAYLDGEEKTARREFEDLIDHWRNTEDRHDAVPGLVTASAFYADDNQPALVAECIDILNIIYADSKNMENRSGREAALAEAAWGRGEVDKAITLASAALAGYESQNLPIEIAWVSRRLGRMLASKGDLENADLNFQKAELIAKRMGMRPLLDAIRADRSGFLAPKNLATAPGPGLTRRQKEVIGLMANGLTNKEVAARLSLSPRTVEMHVGSILERLNCRARTQAIKKAVELRLV